MISRQHRFLIALIILAFFAGTLALSRHRPIDGDEGYYATAARQVSEGRIPYLDFFYPQMPLLPYLYAPVYKMVGSSLANMRLLSVAAGVLSLFLWGLILRRRWPERPGIVMAGLALVAMNPYFLSWNVTVKTFALTNLAVFATVWALDRGLQSRRWSWFLLAGVTAGLGVGVRLLYLPWAGMLALALGWLQLRGMEKGLRLGNMAAYLGGLLVGLAPSAVFLALDPPLPPAQVQLPGGIRLRRRGPGAAGVAGLGEDPVPESLHVLPAGPGWLWRRLDQAEPR
jgi:4-amino-4-deoxy-L-arabinose transferase-like glycosyltransferase